MARPHVDDNDSSRQSESGHADSKASASAMQQGGWSAYGYHPHDVRPRYAQDDNAPTAGPSRHQSSAMGDAAWVAYGFRSAQVKPRFAGQAAQIGVEAPQSPMERVSSATALTQAADNDPRSASGRMTDGMQIEGRKSKGSSVRSSKRGNSDEVGAQASEVIPVPAVVPSMDAPPGAQVGSERPGRHDATHSLHNVTPMRATDVPRDPAPGEQLPILFEIAWEVCWQLGGIYTVLRSKVNAMLDRWGDNYYLIGPYNPQTAALEFEETPSSGSIRQTLDRLREAGVVCHHGRWLVPGRPRVILLDFRSRYMQLDTDKYLLWKDHGIPTVTDDGEVNDVVAFGYTVTEFFRELTNIMPERKILAHFHEWMGGVAVPRIVHDRIPVSTIFTTHATLLGRYLAADNPYFYEHLPFLNPDTEASKYNIYPRFAIERTAAHASSVFTTVSEVTATEAEKLLGRKPDVILPNGLNVQRFAAWHEFQNLHREYKERIHEFVMGHFFPSYSFDLDRTIYLFTSGRYEYTNKGMDLFLEALYRLNQRLKQVPNPPTVVAFIITKAPVRSINVGALQAKSQFEELRSTCTEQAREVGRRLFFATAHGRVPQHMSELIGEDQMVRLKRAIHAWKSPWQPSIVTHDLVDDAGDPILKHLRHRGLFNAADDPVKVVFHPQFMSATSPLISLDYEQFVRGCHLGVFPSYYEPWGYTPMECVAMGLPAVTTDLSGFGAYVVRHLPQSNDHGICVLKRESRSFDDSAEELARYLTHFAQLSRRQRIELRNRVERLSEMFDWSALVRHYHEAHQLALERLGEGRPGRWEVRLV